MIRKFRVVETVPDPLFEPLLDPDRPRNPRSNGHLMWEQPVGGPEFYSAIQFGYAHSYDAIRRETSAAGMHFFLHWIPDLPCVQRDWFSRFDQRMNPGFERMVAEARDDGLTGPVLYAPYYVIGVDDDGNEGVSFWNSGFLPDPINRRAFVQAARECAVRFGDVLWGVCVGDEQIARQWSVSAKWFAENPRDANSPAFLIEADRQVREQYGFGKYGIPWGMSQNDPDYPYSRRAYMSWLIDQLHAANAELAAAVHEVVPDMLIVSEDTHGGTAPSAELWREYCTVGSLQLQFHEQNSYSYGTKMARDLSGLDEIIVVPHDCDAGFPQGQLQMDELRELYSQVFRSGGTGFHFWPSSYGSKEPAPPYPASVRTGHRPAWDYLIKLGKLVLDMPTVKYPTEADAALFVSRESSKSGSTNQRRLARLYDLLGPEERGYFVFVSDTQLAMGHADLDDYKVVYLTDLSYCDDATADALAAYCQAGGTLVCLDPLAFERSTSGESLAHMREGLFGVRVEGERATSETITIGGEVLPVDASVEKAWQVAPVDDATTVLGIFEDGQPAVTERSVGEGRALYFAWSPANRVGMADDAWRRTIAATYTDAGCTFGHDIWRFTFPA